jgi:DNA ligase-associated metallophosphoesterase
MSGGAARIVRSGNDKLQSTILASISGQRVLSITWAGQTLDLYCERAAYWRQARTLLIADPHFGKAAAFRHHGIPVPAGTTQRNLERIGALLEGAGAARLIILGDFLHARAGRADSTMSLIERWRAQREELEIVLVRGNHDQSAGDPPASWDFKCVDEPWVDDGGGLAFCHDANGIDAEACACPCMMGHVHPCVVMHDVDGSTLRSPCFYFGQRCAILPAFGGFTGMHPIRPNHPKDRIFAIGPQSVVEIKMQSQARRG